MLLKLDKKISTQRKQACALQSTGPCNALHAKFAQVMILVTHMHAYIYKAAQQYEQTTEKHTLFADIGAQDSDPKQLFCAIPIELTIENLSFHHQFHSDFTW